VKKPLFLFFPPLLPVVLLLITGILAGNFLPGLPLGIFVACSLVLLVLILFFGSFFGLFYIDKLKPFVMTIGFICLVWGFYSITGWVNPDTPFDHISRFTDSSRYTITGEIDSFSKNYPRKNRVVLSCQFVEKTGIKPARVHGRILLSIYDAKQGDFQYGDLVKFISPLKPIRNFSNPNGFDYEKHMKLAGVFGSAYANAGNIRVIPHPISFYIKIIRVLEQLRNRFFYFTMDRLDNKNAAAIIVALVTGKKEAIPLKLRDEFSRAGGSHILAISGLHLSIVAISFFSLFYSLLALIPMFLIGGIAKKTAGILTLVPLLFYGIFSGFSPSTQRAFVMTGIFMISFLGEKENNPLNTLALAAILILIIDSTALFSISFQLSFGALFFIILGFSLMRVQWKPKKNFLAIVITAALVTFFAGLGTFPLVAHYFNIVSYVQIFANLILVPLMGFICLPLGLGAFLSFVVCPGLAEILLSLCQGILSFCIGYIQFLTCFELSWSRIIGFDIPAVIMAYLFFVALGLILFRQKKTGIVLMVMIVLAGSISFGIEFKAKLFPKDMTITILDVGQGNAALIQTIEGKNILVDGGGFSDRSSFDIGRYVVGPFLWSQKILCLDAVILTHPESDHMNGLLYVLENFKVNLLVKNKDTSSSRTYRDLITLCREKKIKIWHPSDDDVTLGFNQTYLTFLKDDLGLSRPNRNNNSLVFQIRFNQFSMMFTGDILSEREEAIAGKNAHGFNLESRVLLSPHHGSLTSSSKIFLDKVNPESVIVSCGFGNQYGFPHPDVVKRYQDRGYKVFRTDINGAVIISSDGIVYNILAHKGE